MLGWKSPYVLWQRWRRCETLGEIAESLNMEESEVREIVKKYHGEYCESQTLNAECIRIQKRRS